jgi:hypothetical protein
MILSSGNLDAFSAPLCLLAQLSRWKRMGDGLRGPGTRIEMSEVLFFSLGLALIGVIVWLVARWRKRNDMSQRCDDPWKLFRELCQRHDLNRADRRLLQNLVVARRLQQPAELFVTPAAFDPVNLPDNLNEQNLRNLRSRLF